jgi:hypothetical protein
MVAVAYLFAVLGWAAHVRFDLTAVVPRIAGRPAVQRALREEGRI